MNVRARVQIVKGKLREYEGRLKQVEGRLAVLRGRAEQTTGRARLRLLRIERGLRGILDASVDRVESAIKAWSRASSLCSGRPRRFSAACRRASGAV
jgi:hypothetical protein